MVGEVMRVGKALGQVKASRRALKPLTLKPALDLAASIADLAEGTLCR